MKQLWIAGVCLLLSACTVNVQFYPTEVPKQPDTDVPTQQVVPDGLDDGATPSTPDVEDKPTSEIDPAREAIPHALEQKFLDYLEYTEEPDEITQQLTEFLFYTTWFSPPQKNFTSVDSTDDSYLLKTAIMSTKPINIDEITDVDQRNYIETNKLNGYILKEHVQETAKQLFGSEIGLELTDNSMITWDDDKQAYYPPETSIAMYNPVILDYTELANSYVVTVALPRQAMYSEGLYTYDDLPEDAKDYLSLAEAALKCDQREFVISKSTDGTLSLISHELLVDGLIEQ